MSACRRIRLLGRPHAGGVQLRANKPWAIIAYLALADAPVPRARLISLLFDRAQDPAGALRWNLGQVRRLLGRTDALSGSLVSLPGDGSVCFDVEVLAAARWQDAVELEGLGAELLEGMQFPSCAAFETWLIGERRRFAALAEATLQEATLNALSVGNLDDGVRYASRLVTLNPLTDTHQELLIRAYAMNGDLLAARRQLESAVRLFRRELGCDPQPSVFLAAEAASAKIDGPSTPARVRALLEAGQAQVTAGAVDAAVQVLRAACEEADATRDADLAATAHLALGSALIGAGTARHQEGEIALQRAINLAHQSGHRGDPCGRATATLPDPMSCAGSTPSAPTGGWRRPSRWGAAKPGKSWRWRRFAVSACSTVATSTRRSPSSATDSSVIWPGSTPFSRSCRPTPGGPAVLAGVLPHGSRAFGPGAADRTDTFARGPASRRLRSRCSVMSRWPPVIW